ncbi:putative methyltransferase [Mobiluncus curtisii]|uniref:Putative methyltransferase n=1 Tax=Mobiluncus curtisii TaxID=2051 RepID=A0A2X3BLS2_9ACTO|nr:putative methyltransferase [Mobiluncus curtisii]
MYLTATAIGGKKPSATNWTDYYNLDRGSLRWKSQLKMWDTISIPAPSSVPRTVWVCVTYTSWAGGALTAAAPWSDRYLHLHHHPEVQDLVSYAAQQELTIVGMDNFPGAEPLETVTLPSRTLMVFGEESQGLTPAMQNALERLVQITQYGSTRSLNVGHAAAISIWAWRRAYPPRPTNS